MATSCRRVQALFLMALLVCCKGTADDRSDVSPAEHSKTSSEESLKEEQAVPTTETDVQTSSLDSLEKPSELLSEPIQKEEQGQCTPDNKDADNCDTRESTADATEGVQESNPVKTLANNQPILTMQAIGGIGSYEPEEEEDSEGGASKKGDGWTDQSGDQKRTGGRRFFSLMNLIKFLLNPVIEEFHEVEKSNATDIAAKPQVNSSESTEKEEAKNTTDTSKKTKFQCVGRNVTENTTAIVRVVNSTVLLELLSFDKNQTVSDCVLVMFYAPWCHFCAATAPHYNAIGRAFPQLDVLAVDTVHFSNLNARFGTVAVPNIMLFHQSRSAVRFNHTERHFETLVQFIKNTTGLEANSSIDVTEDDYLGPLSSSPTEETDYLLWFAWIFLIVCGGHLFVQSQPGQTAIERVKVLWQEHQHIE